MKKDNKFYIKHILDAVEVIESYLKNVDYEDFLKNKLIQDGIIRELEIIGEAAKRLTDNFKKDYSKIHWKYVCGMRDKLIHDYFGVDLDEVWKTATEDLEKLKQELKKILKD